MSTLPPTPATSLHPGREGIQTRKGSTQSLCDVEERGGWRSEIDENLARVSRRGQQPVFCDRIGRRPALYPASRRAQRLVRVLDKNTLAFAGTAATGNTLPKAICPKIPRPTSS